MAYTADMTRYITDKIRYKAKVTWNVIRYHENGTNVSVVIALLLPTMCRGKAKSHSKEFQDRANRWIVGITRTMFFLLSKCTWTSLFSLTEHTKEKYTSLKSKSMRNHINQGMHTKLNTLAPTLYNVWRSSIHTHAYASDCVYICVYLCVYLYIYMYVFV